jgi:arabinofuranan 3-O-arabinosyltransferase
MGRPRPALYAALRADPDLHRVATFGDPGQNTTDARDTTADASVERNLPPVEIYRIDGTPNELRAASVAPSLLVSGDGFGWPGLAAAGMLNGTAPVEYTGGLDNAGLQAGFENGSPLAVTDSNRRRLRLLVEYDPDYSYLLGDGQDLDRQAQTLFPQPGSQSVAWYPDAVSLSLSGNPRTTLGSEPWNRPANAFDADPGTSWIMRRAQEPNGRTFRIDLRKPSTVDHIKVALAPGITPSSGATQLKLGFSSGPDVLVNITDPVTDLAFPAHETDFITIQIIAVAPNSQSVGFSDITFPGLDLREFVQAPSDVVDRALDDDALAAALMRAPVTYLFSRDTTTAVPAAVPDATAVDHAPTNEVSLRRRFESLGSRPYALDGSLHLGARSSDEQIAAIIGPAAKASATARAGESLAGWGGYAADGDPNTSWIAPAVSSPSVTVSVPPRVLTSVEVSTISDDTAARVKTVEVTVGDLTRTLDLDTSGCASPDQTCKPTGRLLLDTRPTAGEVKVTVKAVDTAGRAQRKQVKIAEVQVNEVANEALDLGAPISTECRPLGLSVDALPVPVRISGTVADVLASRPLPWTACSAVDLGAGWHVTDTMTEVLFDRIRLVTTDVPPTRPAPTAAPTVQVVSQSGNLIHLRLDGAGPSTLWLGQSFDLRWLASVDGATPVVATPLDTQSGWAIPGGSHDVVLRFRPAHLFNISLLVTGSAVVVCLWLALRRRRPHPEPPRPAPGW